MGWEYPTPQGNTDALANAADGLQPKDTPLIIIGYFDGANVLRKWTPTIFKPQNALSVASEATVWTPAAGKKFRWLAFMLLGDVSGAYTFRDNTAGTVIFTIPLTANVATPYVEIGASGLLSAVANNVLTCTGPAVSHLTGIIAGAEV